MAKKLQVIILVVCLGISFIAPLAHSQKQPEAQQVAQRTSEPDGPRPGTTG